MIAIEIAHQTSRSDWMIIQNVKRLLIHRRKIVTIATSHHEVAILTRRVVTAAIALAMIISVMLKFHDIRAARVTVLTQIELIHQHRLIKIDIPIDLHHQLIIDRVVAIEMKTLEMAQANHRDFMIRKRTHAMIVLRFQHQTHGHQAFHIPNLQA